MTYFVYEEIDSCSLTPVHAYAEFVSQKNGNLILSPDKINFIALSDFKMILRFDCAVII